MKITTSPVTVNSDVQTVKTFLSAPKNIELLVKNEGISNFQSTDTECSFKVKGGILIPLVLNSSSNSLINYISGPKAPFKFNLDIHLSENDTITSAYLNFDGDVNPFLKIMVESPLKQLFERMKDELTLQFNS